MNQKELDRYVGRRIKEERLRMKLTQKQLGDLIGVKHNTISSYESGVNAPEQNAIFKIARALNKKVDDFFPNDDNESDLLHKALGLDDSNVLDLEDMAFLKQLAEKAMSLEGEERARFLESIKFTVDYYDNMNKKD